MQLQENWDSNFYQSLTSIFLLRLLHTGLENNALLPLSLRINETSFYWRSFAVSCSIFFLYSCVSMRACLLCFLPFTWNKKKIGIEGGGMKRATSKHFSVKQAASKSSPSFCWYLLLFNQVWQTLITIFCGRICCICWKCCQSNFFLVL